MKYLIICLLAGLLPQIAFGESFPAQSDLGYHLAAYFRDVDLNNDGTKESIKVIAPHRLSTNIPDCAWGDDTGVVIKIINSAGEEVFYAEVGRYRPVEKVIIEDAERQGLKDIVIILGASAGEEALTKRYGWVEGGYAELK